MCVPAGDDVSFLERRVMVMAVYLENNQSAMTRWKMEDDLQCSRNLGYARSSRFIFLERRVMVIAVSGK